MRPYNRASYNRGSYNRASVQPCQLRTVIRNHPLPARQSRQNLAIPLSVHVEMYRFTLVAFPRVPSATNTVTDSPGSQLRSPSPDAPSRLANSTGLLPSRNRPHPCSPKARPAPKCGSAPAESCSFCSRDGGATIRFRLRLAHLLASSAHRSVSVRRG